MTKLEALIYTLAEGQPRPDASTAQRFSDGTPVKGLMLLQDTQLIETLAHFNRERIPERVVHARAAGAWGEFEVTHNTLADITSANFLNGVGNKCKALLRISTVGPGSGSADTLRDIRGWALKLFTQEGNQDFVFNDFPVFFVRDPMKFPSLNRSHKRHPATNITDASMFWDFHNNNQEGMHALMMLFSDRGTPKSVRHVHGFSGSTYKLINEASGTFHYVKFHFKTNQGIENLTNKEATTLAGQSPDNHLADLHSAIQHGNFPSWNMSVQIMTPEQAEGYRWNIFDMTKIWPHGDFPLVPVGKLTMNRNPNNFFTDIEQAAFSPSNMVPGLGPSADPILQARMFAYPDAARYRLGANYQFLPANRPVNPVYSPYQRDGLMNFTDNYGGDPNYVGSQLHPVSFKAAPAQKGGAVDRTHEEWLRGRVAEYASEVTDEDFVQPRMLWEVMGQTGQREALARNIAAHLQDAVPELHETAIQMFARVHPDLGEEIRAALRQMA